MKLFSLFHSTGCSATVLASDIHEAISKLGWEPSQVRVHEIQQATGQMTLEKQAQSEVESSQAIRRAAEVY